MIVLGLRLAMGDFIIRIELHGTLNFEYIWWYTLSDYSDPCIDVGPPSLLQVEGSSFVNTLPKDWVTTKPGNTRSNLNPT